MRNKGFTIIELGIVVFIMGLTIFFLSPLVSIVQDKIFEIREINNLQEISIAIREYALENDGKPPKGLTLIYTEGYTSDESVFDYPFTQRLGTARDPEYVYTGKFYFETPENPVICYSEEEARRSGACYGLFLNGEIVKISADEARAGMAAE